MLLHKLPHLMKRSLGSTLERGEMNSGEVVLNWNEFPEVEHYDPNIEATYPSGTPKTLTVTGLIHFVNQSMVAEKFAEFAAGDALVTFEAELKVYSGVTPIADINLETLRDLTFTLPDGQIYVPSKTGNEVTKFYDLVIGGQRMSRTVALRLK